MIVLQDVIAFLESFAPPGLAEAWDNVGLLVGDRSATISSALTCLTLTPDVADEATDAGCGLVVTHHPLLFRAVQRVTGDTEEGAMLLRLIRAGVAVHSPHTSYDSAAGGINRQLAELLELQNVEPLRAASSGLRNEAEIADRVGGGRCGDLSAPASLSSLIERVKQRLNVAGLHFVGDEQRVIRRLAIACGSAAEFLTDAHRAGCEALLTGEARFHACLEAKSLEVAMILPGHYATERPAMERMATMLSERFPELSVHASRNERDPLKWR